MSLPLCDSPKIRHKKRRRRKGPTRLGSLDGHQEIPWELVASFLPFQDVLALRIVCQDCLTRLHERAGPDDCLIWLSALLRERNLYIISNIHQWKEASQEASDELRSLFDPEKSTALDCLLRCVKVLRYLPHQAAVSYTGKFGRHAVPITPETLYPYTPCRKGKKDCATCRFKIPKKALRSSASNETRTSIVLDDYFGITVDRHSCVDLDHYHTKCIPNLPTTLQCPKCRTNDKRTLVLSVMTYETSPETRRRSSHLQMTFTPCHDDENGEDSNSNAASDESSSDSTRDRRKTQASTFPPIYKEVFIPKGQNFNSEDAIFTNDFLRDCKHSVAIHCSHCLEFGVLAPVAMCYKLDACRRVSHRTTVGRQPYEVALGGAVIRRKPWNDSEDTTTCILCVAAENDRSEAHSSASNESDF